MARIGMKSAAPKLTYGFVYYLTNPSMPGIVKIGMTTKHPRERMLELSRATACPEPFELLAFFDTHMPEFVEQQIHKSLSQYRVNNAREFFAAPLHELQNEMRSWGDPSSGCFYDQHLDRLCDELYGCDRPDSTVEG